MAIASPGIGSNLDVNGIIGQLMEIEQRPLLLLDQKEAGFQAELSAYGTLSGTISSFQDAVKDLNNLSKFQNLNVVSSDKTVFTASAGTTAGPGSFSVEVTQLAKAQKLASVGQANTTDVVGNGTLTFDFGTISGGTFDSNTGKYTGASFASNGSGASTVTIDSTNNSLLGIRDAINAAKIGITASIVNDGGVSPYRLSLSSDKIGEKNSIKVTVTGDAALSTLLAHDPAATQNLSETVTAKDANLKVDGISIVKTSNTITDVIQGMTLNLLKENIGSAETLTVTQDTSGLKTSVDTFVNSFNTVNSAISDLIAFDPVTNQAGLLQGDTSVLSIQRQIRRVMTSSVTALTGAFTALSDIGVSFQKDGTLALDSTRLQTAIDTNFNDIAGLFVAIGKPSDSLIKYDSATDKTSPGNYAVSVTSLATQGKTVGSAAAGLTITTGINDTLTVTVDGGSATVTLAAGTYTAGTLATEVQSKINGANAFSTAGISVTVSESVGVLTMTSAGYGSASKVNVTGGNGKTNLLGTPTDTTGTDVAGTINNSAATGFGQFLTGSAGSTAEGLKIKITGGATGSRGTIAYSEGYAFQLEKLAVDLLGTSGQIASRTDGINRRIEDIIGQREVLSSRLFDTEKNLRDQFTRLDVLLSGMTATGSFLTQQFSILTGLTNFSATN